MKDSTAYKALLIRQQIERINHKHSEYHAAMRAASEDVFDLIDRDFRVFTERLSEDVKILHKGLIEDGYTYSGNSYFEGDLAEHYKTDHEYDFVPIIKDGYADPQIVEIWRKAAQS